MPATGIFVKSLAFGLSQKRSGQAGSAFSKSSVVSAIEADHRRKSSNTSPYKFPPQSHA